MTVDNSNLTGEGDPQQRSVETNNPGVLEADNLAFMGTTVMGGKGIGLVIARGTHTPIYLYHHNSAVFLSASYLAVTHGDGISMASGAVHAYFSNNNNNNAVSLKQPAPSQSVLACKHEH
eukprot:1811-Heterococcus_DN1.PRE.4